MAAGRASHADRPAIPAHHLIRYPVAKASGPPKAEQIQRALDEANRHRQTYGFGRWILRRNGTTIKLTHCHVLGRAEVEPGIHQKPKGRWRNQAKPTQPHPQRRLVRTPCHRL